jgi:molybdopterin-guanine dinucleotide biosynthesis protein A
MDIEGFVLVGGKSSRFGRPKALLKFDGVTLAEKAASTISAALSPKQIYLAAANEEQFAGDEGLPKDLPVIFDRCKDRGAFGGLHAALKQAQSEWIFVLACDYPFVSADLLKYLAGLIDGAFEAVVPVQPDGRVQPLCAFYRVEPCLKIVEKFLAANEKLPPLRAVFENVRTRFVGFDELKDLPGAENFFLNLNSPEDLNGLELRL